MANESVTQKLHMRGNSISIIEWDVTCDDTDGSMTDTNAKNRAGDDISFKGEIVNAIEYIPGSPGPSNIPLPISSSTMP